MNLLSKKQSSLKINSVEESHAALRACLPGRVLAAPSWVIPGSITENCAFLATRVDEVGLLFLESSSCMGYGNDELPVWLGELPLKYHVHLPVDLPEESPSEAAHICYYLLQKVAFLANSQARSGVGHGTAQHVRAVLHPPQRDPACGETASRKLGEFLEAFAALGGDTSLLLLENIRGNDLTGHLALLREFSLSVCVDLGHALAYDQLGILRHDALMERLAMTHLSAPGRGQAASAHLPLAALDHRGREAAAFLCRALPPGGVLMLELFAWQHIEDSLPVMRSWLSQ